MTLEIASGVIAIAGILIAAWLWLGKRTAVLVIPLLVLFPQPAQAFTWQDLFKSRQQQAQPGPVNGKCPTLQVRRKSGSKTVQAGRPKY